MALLLFAVAFSVAWPSSMALAARVVGVVPDEVSFGTGPTLFARRCGATRVRLCALPFGGSVKLERDDERRLPTWRLALVVLASSGVLLAACVLAGASGSDFWAGLTLPVRVVHPLRALEAWNAALTSSPGGAAAALGARLTVLNLVPFPSSASAMVLLRPLPRDVEERVRLVGVGVQLVWFVGWLILGFVRG